jgi:hypothetical protein
LEVRLAKHTIDFDIPTQVLRNVDMVCKPQSDGLLLGTLRLSKGTVDWIPSGHTVNTKTWTWERFARLLEDGVVPRTPAKKRRKK